MESNTQRERGALQLEIDSTIEKYSQNHKRGLGSCQWNQGDLVAKDILGRIDQQKRRDETQILSMESTNKLEEAGPKSFQRNQLAKKEAGRKSSQRNQPTKQKWWDLYPLNKIDQ